MEELRILGESQATRLALALQHKPKASKIVREAKALNEPQAPMPHQEKALRTAKVAKPHITRAEKAARKAEALDAAKSATKKSVKT